MTYTISHDMFGCVLRPDVCFSQVDHSLFSEVCRHMELPPFIRRKKVRERGRKGGKEGGREGEKEVCGR